jgi:hypothetical protein
VGVKSHTSRTSRIDLRLTPVMKAELETVAYFTRRTLTSIMDEAMEDIIKKYPNPEGKK